ncbi:MAG: type IV toxin-antitoxin system AbiEi family antitoxin, partial [Arenibacter sp.]
TEPRNKLMKNYRLVPDEGGNVKIYEKFWKDNTEEKEAVHPLLAYADLIMKGDRRCTETAEKIYNEYLQDKF